MTRVRSPGVDSPGRKSRSRPLLRDAGKSTSARIDFRTQHYFLLLKSIPCALSLGAGLFALGEVARDQSLLGLSAAVLVGDGMLVGTLIAEDRKRVTLVAAGLVLPLAKPISDPLKYRLFTERPRRAFAPFSAIVAIRPTLHDFSSRQRIVLPGIRLFLGGPRVATIPAHPWVDLPLLLAHLREGLGPRWQAVFRAEEPITNRIEDFPQIWAPLLDEFVRGKRIG